MVPSDCALLMGNARNHQILIGIGSFSCLVDSFDHKAGNSVLMKESP